MQYSNSTLRLSGIKYGLLLGILLLVISIAAVYYTAYINTSVVALVIALFLTKYPLQILFGLGFAVLLKRSIGNYWSLKQATTGIFFMFYTALVIAYFGFNVVFVHLLHPAAVLEANKHTVQSFRQAQQHNGVPPSEINKRATELQRNLNAGMHITVGNVVTYLLLGVVFAFIAAFIFGVLLKREPPLFTRNVDYE